MNKKSAFTVVKDLAKKNGFLKQVQRYKCSFCGKQFIGGGDLITPNYGTNM